MMDEFLALVNKFEIRNDFSVSVTIFADGSSTMTEFWEDEPIEDFESMEELLSYLSDENNRRLTK